MTSNAKQEADRRYYLTHKDELLEKAKQWQIQHPGYMKDYLKSYYINNKLKHTMNVKEWQKTHPVNVQMIKLRNATKHRERYSQSRKLKMKEKRLLLFDILGGRICIRCGYSNDTRALTFDHVRDDGHEDRKIHYGGYGFYTFYTKNPEIAKSNLQVLCCNCNSIKKYESMEFYFSTT